jgi:hypothetical protein
MGIPRRVVIASELDLEDDKIAACVRVFPEERVAPTVSLAHREALHARELSGEQSLAQLLKGLRV